MMAKARSVTDSMFVAASSALAACVSEEQLGQKRLYPDIKDLREVSAKVRCVCLSVCVWVCECVCVSVERCPNTKDMRQVSAKVCGRGAGTAGLQGCWAAGPVGPPVGLAACCLLPPGL